MLTIKQHFAPALLSTTSFVSLSVYDIFSILLMNHISAALMMFSAAVLMNHVMHVSWWAQYSSQVRSFWS